jgi:hypothetical protein
MSKPTFEQNGNNNTQNNVTGKKAKLTYVTNVTNAAAGVPGYSPDKKWLRPLPVERRGLTLLAVLGSVASIISLVVAFWPLITVEAAGGGPTPVQPQWVLPVCLVALIVGGAFVTLGWIGARMIVLGRRHVFRCSLLPSIEASGGKLYLTRYVGTCTTCGGKLRFASVPIDWRDESDGNGGTRSVVVEREFRGTCNRNPDHISRLSLEVGTSGTV